MNMRGEILVIWGKTKKTTNYNCHLGTSGQRGSYGIVAQRCCGKWRFRACSWPCTGRRAHTPPLSRCWCLWLGSPSGASWSRWGHLPRQSGCRSSSKRNWRTCRSTVMASLCITFRVTSKCEAKHFRVWQSDNIHIRLIFTVLLKMLYRRTT